MLSYSTKARLGNLVNDFLTGLNPEWFTFLQMAHGMATEVIGHRI